MAKRIMVAVVGAGIGALAGLLVAYLAGGGALPLFGGAAVGAILPLVTLGKPGK